VFWALRHGERWSGMAVHMMDRGLDTGGILYQVRVRTRQDDTVESLYDRILKRSSNLMRRLIDDAGRGRLRPRAQETLTLLTTPPSTRMTSCWTGAKQRKS